MGASAKERRAAYKAFVEDSVNAESSSQFVQTALDRNQLTENNTFIGDLEDSIGIRVGFRGSDKPVV
jgi:hypothetical protein